MGGFLSVLIRCATFNGSRVRLPEPCAPFVGATVRCAFPGPKKIVFVYQPDVPLKSVVRRFCWTKGGAWRTVGLDETRWSVRRRQAT
jgi:hypothetical protein